MGNNASKDSSHGNRGTNRRHDEDGEHGERHQTPQHSSSERIIAIYGPAASSSRRGSRPDIPFLHLNRDRNAESSTQKPRETRQEKEARRAERERQARLKERERSIKEEHVDGGFLVTLGTYIGPEDFSKPVVRQLQIERRLAPFWKGLNDHSDSWTEYQLVAAVRGLPIPAADEIPESLQQSTTRTSNQAAEDGDSSKQSIAVPTTTRAQAETKSTTQLSASHPATSSGLAPLSALGSSPLLRGRAKTLATLAGGSRGATPPDLTPQEIQLPHDPNVNGLPIEAYLYREPGECPICFLYYPPYLNKTRCCDQPICSECFVQIKRPDPHLPEHEQPGQPRRPEEHAELLVSEVAACPFCVAPEFGVTYMAPSFRRGLVYANQGLSNIASNIRSATSSQTSLQSGERRRTISISASAPEVVTTDMVRPDWAKRLADARAQALRRSAAATALHNAAYVLSGGPESGLRQTYGRRRRSLFTESAAGSGSQSPREGEDANSSNELFPGRTSSRRSRVEDLEDLMMMEAIRLSLAAEEERKRKEVKDKAKDDKKKAKEAKKEAKQLEKLAKKGGGSSSSLYKIQSNDSTSTWASTSMVRSSSNLGSQPMILEEETQGKGKAAVSNDSPGDVHRTPTADSQASDKTASAIAAGDAQRHLEESRANIQHTPSNPVPMPQRGQHFRQLSTNSSLASSFVDSAAGSLQAESPSPDAYAGSRDGSPFRSSTPSGPTGSLEPMLNFQSLAAMIDNESKTSPNDHIEHVKDSEKLAKAEEELKGHSRSVSSAGSIISDAASRGHVNDTGSSSPTAAVGALDIADKDAVASSTTTTAGVGKPSQVA